MVEFGDPTSISFTRLATPRDEGLRSSAEGDRTLSQFRGLFRCRWPRTPIIKAPFENAGLIRRKS